MDAQDRFCGACGRSIAPAATAREPRGESAPALGAVGTPNVGSVVGGYRLDRLIGQGATSVVFLAEHLTLGRTVALKLLAPETSVEGWRRRRARLLCESRVIAALEHPYVIPIYDAGDAGQRIYIAMRYVAGGDLGGLIRRQGRLEPGRAVRIVSQVASALDAAHARNVLHRDVRPGNVLLSQTADGTDHAYLADFGLSKLTIVGRSEFSKTGQLEGTFEYVAPEQIRGDAIDGRADQYSLACVLYEALTGTPPFSADTELTLLWAHLENTPQPVTERQPQLPVALNHVLSHALAKNPAQRFPTCTRLAEAAQAAITPQPEPEPEPAAEPPRKQLGVPGTAVPADPAAGAVAARPTPAPAIARARSGRRVIALIVTAAAVAAGSIGVGMAIGGGGDSNVSPLSSPPPPVRVDQAETIEFAGGWIEVPEGWRRVAVAPEIPGLGVAEAVAVSPTGSEDSFGIILGEIAAEPRALLPNAFLDRVADQVESEAIFVDLGRVEARRYEDLQPSGFAGRLAVYVMPTTEQTLAAVCFSTGSRPLSDCEPVLATVSLGATAVSPRLPEDYASAVDSALDVLSRTLQEASSRLERATTPAAQQKATARVAAAYDLALRAFAAVTGTPLVSRAHANLTRALDHLRADYVALGAAAAREDHAAWGAARRSIRTHSAWFRHALEQLAHLGFVVA